MRLTASEIGLIRTAIGVGEGRDQRNFYATDAGSADDKAWAAMVRKGAAVLSAPAGSPGMPFNLYAVTVDGIAEVTAS